MKNIESDSDSAIGSGGGRTVAESGAEPSIDYFVDAAFFCSAHRRLTASAMRFLPSGVRFLFFADFFAAGAGALLGAAVVDPPLSSVRAFCN